MFLTQKGPHIIIAALGLTTEPKQEAAITQTSLDTAMSLMRKFLPNINLSPLKKLLHQIGEETRTTGTNEETTIGRIVTGMKETGMNLSQGPNRNSGVTGGKTHTTPSRIRGLRGTRGIDGATNEISGAGPRQIGGKVQLKMFANTNLRNTMTNLRQVVMNNTIVSDRTKLTVTVAMNTEKKASEATDHSLSTDLTPANSEGPTTIDLCSPTPLTNVGDVKDKQNTLSMQRKHSEEKKAPKSKKSKQKPSEEAKREADLMRRELNKHITKHTATTKRRKSSESSTTKTKPHVSKVVGEIEAQLDSIKQGSTKDLTDSIAKLINLAETLKQNENMTTIFPTFTMPLNAINENSNRYRHILSLVDEKSNEFEEMINKPVTCDLTCPFIVNLTKPLEDMQQKYINEFWDILKPSHPNVIENKQTGNSSQAKVITDNPLPTETSHTPTNTAHTTSILPSHRPQVSAAAILSASATTNISPVEFSDSSADVSPVKKARKSAKQVNFFYVYNPHNTEACRKMSEYLFRFNGSLFDIQGLGNNFKHEIALNATYDANIVDKILPHGNFWIIIRSVVYIN